MVSIRFPPLTVPYSVLALPIAFPLTADRVGQRRAGRQITYKGLVEKLAALGIQESEANLRNKISRGGFTGAFLVQCLVAMGVTTLRLDD